MAITSIAINQDNKIGNVNLLSVHNPLVFLIDVTYTLETPEILNVDLLDENSNVLNTFSAIPYEDDEDNGVRTFAFLASDILRAYMDDIDDFESLEKTLEHVDNITKSFILRFYIDIYSTTISFIACHAARQFGESPCLENIYNNEDEIYYTGNGNPVYIYFYNSNVGNILTIDVPAINENAALDYDDVVFVDFDNNYFKLQ